mgnify:CR=1 FL=1
MTVTPEKPEANEPLTRLSRRNVLAAAGGGGAILLLGFYLRPKKGAEEKAGAGAEAIGPASELVPAYITLTPDNYVELVCPAAEMGQGVISVLPAVIAEEMEADWERVRVLNSDAGEIYINPGKNLQATGRSMSVRGYFDRLREVGAEAKARLLRAASEVWGAPVSECVADASYVLHPATGRKATFFELAERAASYDVVEPAPFKARKDYKIIGKPIQRKDIPEKVTGQAVYGVDIVEDGMLVAAVAMSPTLNGYPSAYDADAALALKGVRHVIETEQGGYRGVAVVADSYWRA